jgi:ribosomal-protein-alanine acetyltransferase
MIELERQIQFAAHWPLQHYEDLFSEKSHAPSERFAWVIENQKDSQISAKAPTSENATPKQLATLHLLGFLIAHRIAADWELENILVATHARRKGLGAFLLNHFISQARESQAKSIFLEVRESNQSARSLYEKLGFANIGSRENYYANPQENAVLCRLNLPHIAPLPSTKPT